MAFEYVRFDEYYVLLSSAALAGQGNRTTKKKKKQKSEKQNSKHKKSGKEPAPAANTLPSSPIKPPPFNRTKQTPVFIFAGQSNMVGRCELASATTMHHAPGREFRLSPKGNNLN